METKDSSPSPEDITAAILAVVSTLLEDGAAPADVVYHLVAIGADMGIQTAPTPEAALVVIFGGMRDMALAHTAQASGEGAERDSETGTTSDAAIREVRAPGGETIH